MHVPAPMSLQNSFANVVTKLLRMSVSAARVPWKLSARQPGSLTRPAQHNLDLIGQGFDSSRQTLVFLSTAPRQEHAGQRCFAMKTLLRFFFRLLYHQFA